MKRMFNALLLLLLLAIVTACQNDVDELISEEPLAHANFESDKVIIAKLGFDTLAVIDEGDSYVVEGDIVLNKRLLSKYSEIPNQEEGEDFRQTKQAMHTAGLVSSTKVRAITVGFDSSLTSDAWKVATLDALSEWSNIPGCAVKLIHTTSANPDIKIGGVSSFGGTTIARASFPSSGNPGPTINVSYAYNHLSSSEKLFTMIHELGHCLGLRHTNWKNIGEGNAIHIPGTSESDSESVMHNTVRGWEGFTYDDVLAVQYMYPQNNAVSLSTGSSLCSQGEVTFSLSDIDLSNNTSVKWEAVSSSSLISGQGTLNAVFETWISYAHFVKVRAIVRYYNNDFVFESSPRWIGIPAYASMSNTEIDKFSPGSSCIFSTVEPKEFVEKGITSENTYYWIFTSFGDERMIPKIVDPKTGLDTDWLSFRSKSIQLRMPSPSVVDKVTKANRWFILELRVTNSCGTYRVSRTYKVDYASTGGGGGGGITPPIEVLPVQP